MNAMPKQIAPNVFEGFEVSGGSKSGNPNGPLDNPLLVLLSHSIEIIQLAEALAKERQCISRFINSIRMMNEPGNSSFVILLGSDAKLVYPSFDR